MNKILEMKFGSHLYGTNTPNSDLDYKAIYLPTAREIILDFEILTRFTPYLMIDDRKRVVDMWRKRGFVCLQCAEGHFNGK